MGENWRLIFSFSWTIADSSRNSSVVVDMLGRVRTLDVIGIKRIEWSSIIPEWSSSWRNLLSWFWVLVRPNIAFLGSLSHVRRVRHSLGCCHVELHLSWLRSSALIFSLTVDVIDVHVVSYLSWFVNRLCLSSINILLYNSILKLLMCPSCFWLGLQPKNQVDRNILHLWTCSNIVLIIQIWNIFLIN